MRVSYQLVTPPTIEPATLLQAKKQCGVDEAFEDDDDLIAGYIASARDYCERIMHRAIFNQSWMLTLDEFPSQTRLDVAYMPIPSWDGAWYRETAIRLPMARTVSVESVTWIDDAGTEHTLPPTSYRVDTKSEPGSVIPIAGAYWPLISGLYPGAISVKYTCGSYGDGSDLSKVPPSIVNAILLLVGHWYAHREATDPQASKQAEFSVAALLRPYVVRS
jgi:uncharacterized phiE125 gp8 family phage protein